MYSQEKKFEKAIEFMTPRAVKWGEEVVDAVSHLDLEEEGKDAMLIWIVELLLFQTPYPNRIITNTLATIIAHISGGEALGDLDWSKREKIFRRKKID
ncbi:MAG: hypothetical protein ACRD38_04450 [Nitrososphaerales archaeon]